MLLDWYCCVHEGIESLYCQLVVCWAAQGPCEGCCVDYVVQNPLLGVQREIEDWRGSCSQSTTSICTGNCDG